MLFDRVVGCGEAELRHSRCRRLLSGAGFVTLRANLRKPLTLVPKLQRL